MLLRDWLNLLRPSRGAMPDPHGVADARWYDDVVQRNPEYAVPYHHSRYYVLWAVIADRVRRTGAKRILEIGCGSGQLAQCLYAMAGITSYTGLDFSPTSIALARRLCPEGCFLVDDALTTRAHEKTPHDVVICTEVLEHIPDDLAVLRRFKQGVPCLATVPNFMCASHVRCFSGVEAVRERYGPCFQSLDVWPVRSFQKNESMWFLMDGIVKG